jgi:DNA-binding NtrC family response regulator
MSARILIVDDDPDIRLSLHDRLLGLGYRVFEAASCAQAREVLEKHELDLILLDLQLPDGDGLTILEEVRNLGESAEVIVISAHGTIQKAVEAMKQGIFDFVTKPFCLLDLEGRIKKTLDYRRLKREAASFRTGPQEFKHRIVGKSQKMTECLEICQRLAQTNTTVLIQGETGTGKEVLAHYIHARSQRANRPFVVLSCANFSEHLIEDELFGHEQGAFTGAVKLKQGKVELADGGTLFFDEIGELPNELQAKLLRFLEEKQYNRVGGNKERETDVRLIAATNRDLATAVRKGLFREDLYYRLNVYPILLPPLRERREDIPDLVHHFWGQMATRQPEKGFIIEDEALTILMQYHWPGNVRELRNVVERAMVLATDGVIKSEHLLLPIHTPSRVLMAVKSHKEQMNEYERSLLLSVLEQTGWNQTEAAKRLNLNRTHFIRLMNRHGLRVTRRIDRLTPFSS